MVTGAKRPMTPKQMWKRRFHLERDPRMRDLALFDLAIDSKLRGCDVVTIRFGDVVRGGKVKCHEMVVQEKSGRPVQLEQTEPARNSLTQWRERQGDTLADFVFPSRVDATDHLSTRQYARLVDEWVAAIGLQQKD